MALTRIAQEHQGYFTTQEAIEAGYADNTHAYHVRAGNWVRVRRGVYRLPFLPVPEDGEMMAHLLWSRGRDQKPLGVLSHQTALSLYDIGDFNPSKIHLTVPRAFRRNSAVPKGVVLHHDDLDPQEVREMRGLTVCHPIRALVDVAKSDPTSLDELRTGAEEAFKKGLITSRDIARSLNSKKDGDLAKKLFQ